MQIGRNELRVSDPAKCGGDAGGERRYVGQREYQALIHPRRPWPSFAGARRSCSRRWSRAHSVGRWLDLS
jgi:hypothetical protein